MKSLAQRLNLHAMWATGAIRPGDAPARIVAVLGPTNTGKTHYAIERMLGHRSGMIGFPLRLLARENYDRVCRRLGGAGGVALITGEERILPPSPRYYLCTVEAMPVDIRVAFLAVDEIQLCADPERGHVFTDRLLHARGQEETLFLGSETVQGIIRKLAPGVAFATRPRMSRLAYVGRHKITRLPPRSAVIAFSAANVYAMAELLRRQRGGAAIVLGALSPRTRNAQVAMYEAGEVDYLVATDAIGMGLNMRIDHVAFSALSKFDGHSPRRLSAAELGQIAGRAGRHLRDGSFGVTGDLAALDPALVEALENHRFERVRRARWRNAALEFASIEALMRSLDMRPPAPQLMRARIGDDRAALAAVAQDEEVRRLAGSPDRIRSLWDVCQIPDFRKDYTDGHARMIARIFGFLCAPSASIPPDWVARAIDRINRTDGDIDTLVARIAQTRTWTYIAHRADWLDDARAWQERAGALEDKLSDALHRRLTQRFVDRQTAVLVRRLAAVGGAAPAVLRPGGEVMLDHESIGQESIGRVEGFRFVPARAVAGDKAPWRTAANRAVRDGMAAHLARFLAAGPDALVLDRDGRILWEGAPVARLARGADALHPSVEAVGADLLDPPQRARVRRHAATWLDAYLANALAPLYGLGGLGGAEGALRGLLFQLAHDLGAVPRAQVEGLLADIGGKDRQRLARLGVRIGVETLYMPALLRARETGLRALLWAVESDCPAALAVPPPGRTSLARAAERPARYYFAIGYNPKGEYAIRVDLLERVLMALRRLARKGPALAPAELMTMIGANAEGFAAIARACGFSARVEAGGVTVSRRRRDTRFRPAPRGAPRRAGHATPDGPFASLSALRVAE